MIHAFLNPKLFIGNPSVGFIETILDDKSVKESWSLQIQHLKFGCVLLQKSIWTLIDRIFSLQLVKRYFMMYSCSKKMNTVRVF